MKINLLVKICIIILVGFFSQCHFLMASDQKGKVFEKKDIIIYDLDTSGKKNHFKAIFFINTDLNRFKKLVLNPENHKQWVNNIKSAENIRTINDTIIYTYILLNVKSILKKEAVVKTRIKKSADKSKAYITQQIDTSLHYDAEYDKLKYFIAQWDIQEVERNKVKVQLSFVGDKSHYPKFIDRYLKSLFIKKLYRLAYRSRKQAINMK